MSLREYKRKRRFDKTTEPKAKSRKTSPNRPLAFVVQKHAAKNLHYDFRLELDGVLKSWAVPKGPSLDPSDKRLAIMTEDHPLEYQDFEGEIPKGEYGAGRVKIWDNGVYTSDKTADLNASKKFIKNGLRQGNLGIVLLGKKIKGKFVLVRTGNEKNWLLIKYDDEFAVKDTANNLRASKASIDPIPKKIKPMLAKMIEAPFDADGWLFEPKWDGYRAIAHVAGNDHQLYSRNGKSFLKKYPEIAEALGSFKKDCVLDGEIIAISDGQPDFHALQRHAENPAELQYAIFDLLYFDGTDLRQKTLKERKDILEKNFPKHNRLVYSRHMEKKGKYLFDEITKLKMEGIMAKNKQSKYLEGKRSEDWLKIKSTHEQEAVIVGFTEGRGSRKYLGSLVLAVYLGDKLRYIGQSGGGFTDTELRDLYVKLEKIQTKKPPISDNLKLKNKIT